MPFEVITVPCLSDNYAFILHETDSGQTAVVDVPEAKPILAALSDKGWSLDHILITHHHDDHIMGVEDSLRSTRSCQMGTHSNLGPKHAV